MFCSIHSFCNSQNSFSYGPLFGPFWSVKYHILSKSYQVGQPIILFQKANTPRLLEIPIMFLSQRGAKKGYHLKDYMLQQKVIPEIQHLKGLRNCISCIFSMWSLFCSVQVYIILHFGPILLEKQVFVILCFDFYLSISLVFSCYFFSSMF